MFTQHMYDLFITIYCNMFYQDLFTFNVKKVISIHTLSATSHQGVDYNTAYRNP